MFSKDEREGTHHTCLEDLQRAAEGGCKICIALVLRRETRGPEPEAEETATPFLQYCWGPYRSSGIWPDVSYAREIDFVSKIRWLKNHVDVHAYHTGEPVPEWYLHVSKNAASDIESPPWRVRRELFPLRPIPNSTGHGNVLRIAKMWLENCDRSHNCKMSSTDSTFDCEWYPKRLIDIASAALPRLLETHSERPDSCYATLSHCWGSNVDFITLSTKNLAKFCAGIAVDILPKSFRDAMTVCKQLGIRYLWIDSLCILQDSHSDWLLHTVEMSSVYQNCYLNLSFDFAGNPGQGAFTFRNTDVLQDCEAFYTVPRDLCLAAMGTSDSFSSDNDSTRDFSDNTSEISYKGERSEESSPGETGFMEEEDSTEETLDAMRCLVFAHELDYTSTLWNLPLSRRGWVVQERLLSPRVLHFTNDRIRWECETEKCLQEGLPYGLPNTGQSFDQTSREVFSCIPERGSEQSKWGHFNHWECITRMYSRRLLTYPEKDKLVALAAIAQRFTAVFSEEYFAGHFRENMPFDLAWSVLGRHPDQDSLMKRHPTWSWTSVDAEVSSSSVWCQLKQPLVIVEGVSVDLDDPSYIYGPVNGGQLILRGLVVRCELGASKDSSREGGPDDVRRIHLQEAIGCENCSVQTYVNVTMDAREKAFSKETFLIPLVERTASIADSLGLRRAIMGIILLRQANGFYTRVGCWDTDPDNDFDLDNGPLFDYMDRYLHNHQRVVIV